MRAVRIAILCEGETEKVFKPHLVKFLKARLKGSPVPTLDFVPFRGRLPRHGKLRTIVKRLLGDRRQPADAVIALTDVYTGTNPPEFKDAADAKRNLRQWVGKEPKFHPHAAQYDFEAWLLPYWDVIQRLAGSNRRKPGKHPEHINHVKPPSWRLRETFRTGSKGIQYNKRIDCDRILRNKDLLVAAAECPQLKEFLNTILALCDKSTVIP